MDNIDQEIKTMTTVAKALYELSDNESRGRVIRWIAEKFDVTLSSSRTELQKTEEKVVEHEDYAEFVDLFDAVDPKTDIESALTGAYWYQIIKRNNSWQSYVINNMLKDTGHGISNITSSLDDAQSRKPSLVRQIAKSGKSKQSRKTYKLTTAGADFIAKRLKGGERASDKNTE